MCTLIVGICTFATMFKNMKTLILLALVFSLSGCQQQSSSEKSNSSPNAGENQELYEEVMAIHDEVMPRMDEMYKLKRKLKDHLSQTTISADKQKEIAAAIKQLDIASEGMMEWMRAFNPIPDSAGQEEGRTYLLAEKEKIQQVKEEMLQSIETAKSLE